MRLTRVCGQKIPQEKDELGNETVGEAIAKEETNPSKEDEDLPIKQKIHF
ncbi:MAG: hypothetical protein R2773_05260 [Flavobacteriaceae bacterium]